MSKYLVLYNPLSKRGHGEEDAKRIEKFLDPSEITYVDATKLENDMDYIRSIPADTQVILTGGDGTLNRAMNLIREKGIERPVYYFPAGTGNDFIIDIEKSKDCEPFEIREYMEGLPEVRVNGIRIKFINGIGYGLDGYCCAEHDRYKAMGKERSYVLLAFIGLMHKFKPVHAKITVDGVMKEYDGIYMAPTMFGRYYGGGVKIAPSQNRKNPEHTVTQVAVFSKSRIAALLAFLGVTNGKGETMPKHLEYRTGREVKVEFDKPTALQIDGETVLDVLTYEVSAAK